MLSDCRLNVNMPPHLPSASQVMGQNKTSLPAFILSCFFYLFFLLSCLQVALSRHSNERLITTAHNSRWYCDITVYYSNCFLFNVLKYMDKSPQRLEDLQQNANFLPTNGFITGVYIQYETINILTIITKKGYCMTFFVLSNIWVSFHTNKFFGSLTLICCQAWKFKSNTCCSDQLGVQRSRIQSHRIVSTSDSRYTTGTYIAVSIYFLPVKKCVDFKNPS